MNVDGCIAVCFVDLMRNCGAFSPEEAEDYLKMGVLNGLFVLGRSIGLIAHFLDQKRLRTGLYRHPWESVPSCSFFHLDIHADTFQRHYLPPPNPPSWWRPWWRRPCRGQHGISQCEKKSESILCGIFWLILLVVTRLRYVFRPCEFVFGVDVTTKYYGWCYLPGIHLQLELLDCRFRARVEMRVKSSVGNLNAVKAVLSTPCAFLGKPTSSPTERPHSPTRFNIDYLDTTCSAYDFYFALGGAM